MINPTADGVASFFELLHQDRVHLKRERLGEVALGGWEILSMDQPRGWAVGPTPLADILEETTQSANSTLPGLVLVRRLSPRKLLEPAFDVRETRELREGVELGEV